MGMYTEFVFAVELNSKTIERDGVINILKYMVRDAKRIHPDKLPNHPFFKTERWWMLFTMGSAYFPGITHSDFQCSHGDYFLTVRSNLKNYDSEIELFLDWITPYVVNAHGKCFGYFRYEEDDNPSLIYIDHYDEVSPVKIMRVHPRIVCCTLEPLATFLPDTWHEWMREKE